jgi:hypothetical protein
MSRVLRISALLFLATLTAYAQYPGGMGGTGTATGTYSPTGKSYGVSGAAIGAGVAAGVGAGALLLAMHHHRSMLVGCVSPDGKLVTGKNKTFTLSGDAAQFQPGEKVQLHGKKMQGESFFVKRGKQVGSCN